MNGASKLIGREPNDTKDNDDTHEEQDIIEGLTTQEGNSYIFILLMLTIPVSIHYFQTIYNIPYIFFRTDFGRVLQNQNYNKEEFSKLYDEYKKKSNNKKLLNHKWVLMVFLGFAYMALLLNYENIKEPTKWTIASIVGATVFILKFIPSIISFFENVFGYFFMNIFGRININMSLQNDKFKDGEANIKLNQLMTIFDVENLGKKFNQIGINGEPSKNDGTLFVTFNENASKDNRKTSTFEFFEGLLNASILKRAIGNTSMLLLTTFISIGMLKHYDGLG
jgi:hypothetical protein